MRTSTYFFLATLLFAAPAARGEFRGDEVRPRSFDYNDEYFLNVFSYRQRLTHRWAWGNAASPRWRWFWGDTALGYDVTAGSLRSDELYLRQQAIVRLPWSNHVTGEYRFVEDEDYDSRYRRNEVEVLVRLFRPAYALPLLDTLGRTPLPDGLFFGGQGLLDAEKEHADIGWVLGWRGEWLGLRLDLVQVDYWYNQKNKVGGEYEREPLTFRAKAGALLLEGDLELLAWFQDDLPTTLRLPQDSLTFRYRKQEAGVAARWQVSPGVRADVQAAVERTRKRRRSPDPLANDDLDREALQVFAAAEVDVAPLLGERSSRPNDVVLFGLHGHVLDEETAGLAVGLPGGSTGAPDVTHRRGEVYAEVGYVLGLPTFNDDYQLGLRAQTQNGFLSLRDVRPDEGKHTVSQRFLSKIGLGLELLFRDGLGSAFFQFTFRVDRATFGGGNAQVMMRF
ncbi:MAG: hypothetical protein KF878_37580 [Planctomycetes bacterium]|nr:hypothetical protein [Planctomycetota bacterium]